MRSMYLLPAIASVLLMLPPAAAQTPGDIDAEREEFLSALGDSAIPDHAAIRRVAEELLSRPLSEQGKQELEDLARESNRFANLIGRIVQEYRSYERASSRFNFVIEQLAPYLRAHVEQQNFFLDVRNRAYLNLGRLHEEEGDLLRAFSFYNDAFRLSSFGCPSPTSTEEDCVRLAAERGMLRVIGLDNVLSYVRWQ